MQLEMRLYLVWELDMDMGIGTLESGKELIGGVWEERDGGS